MNTCFHVLPAPSWWRLPPIWSTTDYSSRRLWLVSQLASSSVPQGYSTVRPFGQLEMLDGCPDVKLTRQTFSYRHVSERELIMALGWCHAYALFLWRPLAGLFCFAESAVVLRSSRAMASSLPHSGLNSKLTFFHMQSFCCHCFLFPLYLPTPCPACLPILFSFFLLFFSYEIGLSQQSRSCVCVHHYMW